MPDGEARRGLVVPSMFWGMQHQPAAVAALQALADLPGASDPRGAWFIADNLVTYGHTRGFLTEPRFVEAVLAAQPLREELAIVWRTHTLCWAAEHCRALPGDFVECGTYRGYSAEVVLRYLDGLPERVLWLFDLFEVNGAPGEGHRLVGHSPDLAGQVRARFQAWTNVRVIQGKVPPILDTVAPDRVAFLHVDMNNADAELGALERLFPLVSPGGMVVLDDYGWTGYRAQKQAADRFMAAQRLPILELPTGQGLVVKRP